MDLQRLIALLVANQLLLTRSDLLEDEWEGSITKSAHEHAQNHSEGYAEEDRGIRRTMKQQVYVSCWHANNCESEAMWKLYCGRSDGVALCTTYERLSRIVPFGAYIGKISYVDFERYTGFLQMNDDPLLPLMINRAAQHCDRRAPRREGDSCAYPYPDGIRRARRTISPRPRT
jgi:hypothetical protein